MLIPIFALSLLLPAEATLFQIQSVDQQIKDSDGIVMGHYLKKKSIKLEDGRVTTQMFFKMNKEIGMKSDFFGTDEVIIHYPGGTIDGVTTRVEGVPSFVPGESVVVMVKGLSDRHWGMNLGFGTFKIVSYGKERMIVNSLFPEDRRVGQMKLEDFEKTVKLIKGSNLKVVSAPLYPSEPGGKPVNRLPASVQEGKNRAIASESDSHENRMSGHSFNSWWLLFILASMGGLFRWLRQKEVK